MSAAQAPDMIRSVGLVISLLAATSSLVACGNADSNEGSTTSGGGKVTNIPTSSVIDQGQTGNCWLYATAAWAESLHASATGDKSLHFSPTYWDYWDWYDQIMAGGTQVEFGGFWGRAGNLIHRYGLVPLGSFVDGDDAAVAVQAQVTINQKLAAGGLTDDAGAIDPVQVLAVLNEAFNLSPDKRGLLASTFGADGKHTFPAGAIASGILTSPQNFPVMTFSPTGNTPAMLDDVIGTQGDPNYEDTRTGSLAWTAAFAPATAGASTGLGVSVLPGVTVDQANHSSRSVAQITGPAIGDDDSDAGAPADSDAAAPPVADAGGGGLQLPAPDPAAWTAYLRRVQHALNDGAPLPIAWLVVFDDADATGHFHQGVTTTQNGGWHETLITDYEVVNVPGYGTLSAGVPATDVQKAASLQDPSQVTFLRIKNSWGTTTTGWASPLAGYNDLDTAYLSESIQFCDASGNCAIAAPGVFDIVLPPGY